MPFIRYLPLSEMAELRKHARIACTAAVWDALQTFIRPVAVPTEWPEMAGGVMSPTAAL